MGTFGIFAAVLSAIALLFKGVSSWQETKQANQFNQSQYEDWKEYNTPANQMQRLSEAGLNPYMVNGVSNTLSQPFQVGANHGISEMLGSMSQAAMQAGQYVENLGIKKEANAIRKDSVAIQRDNLEFQKSFGDLKKDLLRSAIKRGDAQAALFWSSVSQKDVVTNFLKRTEPFRVGSAFYDYLQKQQAYSFHELLNPMVLDYYVPTQRAKINNLWANTNHLNWYENFAAQRFLFEQEMRRRDFILRKTLGWQNAEETALDNAFRRRLSQDYYDLGVSKWITNTGLDLIGLGSRPTPLRSHRRKQAGSYDIFDEYEY